jgi:hypothetical protein
MVDSVRHSDQGFSLVSLIKSACVFAVALLAVACTGMPPGHVGADAVDFPLLEASSRLVGDTYAIKGAKQFCGPNMQGCVERKGGSFTVVDAGVLVKEQGAILSITFDDGTSTWTSYEGFVSHNFGAPVETRLKVKRGMSPDQIRATWGEPQQKGPTSEKGLSLETWTYADVGRLSFHDGEVLIIELKRSLLAAK